MNGSHNEPDTIPTRHDTVDAHELWRTKNVESALETLCSQTRTASIFQTASLTPNCISRSRCTGGRRHQVLCENVLPGRPSSDLELACSPAHSAMHSALEIAARPCALD